MPRSAVFRRSGTGRSAPVFGKPDRLVGGAWWGGEPGGSGGAQGARTSVTRFSCWLALGLFATAAAAAAAPNTLDDPAVLARSIAATGSFEPIGRVFAKA